MTNTNLRPTWIAGPYIGVLIGVTLYGLDVALFRPDRTRVDFSQQKDADRRNKARQGTRTALAPDPPVDLPFLQDLEDEGPPARWPSGGGLKASARIGRADLRPPPPPPSSSARFVARGLIVH